MRHWISNIAGEVFGYYKRSGNGFEVSVYFGAVVRVNTHHEAIQLIWRNV